MGLTPHQINDLRALGFRPGKVRAPAERRLWVGTEGLKRSGKTDFMLRTTPGPIAHINIDLGTDDVEEKMITRVGRDDILYCDIRVPSVKEDKAQETAAETWNQIHLAIEGACKSGHIRTVCLDTADAVWEVLRLGQLGALEKVPQQKYDKVNVMMKNLLLMPQNHNLHMIAAHRLSQEWREQEYTTSQGELKSRRAWTGEYERDGFKKTEYIFRVNIRHLSRPNMVMRGGKMVQEGIEFGFRILDCTALPELAGTELWGEVATFPMLGVMMYQDSDLEDWA